MMLRLQIHGRHRAQHSASAALAIVLLAVGALACGGGTVPQPARAPVSAEDYIAVPFVPRSPPVEIVPPRPAQQGDLVWADGGWEWRGERFRWRRGAWVLPPPGAKRAPWAVVRREVDGQLFFAPSIWWDASGRALDPPKPLARASTRVGGPAESEQSAPPSAPGSPDAPARTDLDE